MVRAAARAMGKHPSNFRRDLRTEQKRVRDKSVKIAKAKAEAVKLPKFPRKNQKIETIIKRLAADSSLEAKRQKAERWFRIYINDKKPIAILNFGDPHLGTHTDWERLKKDVAHCATVPGLYGLNMGDTTNNWVGRLMRQYAEEDISKHTERRLAKWFLADAGIIWLAWLMGNHDEWNEGAEILRLMNIHNKVPMLDWQARFELVFPNKKKIRVHCAHDFPGHSMWNPTHGPARQPRMNGSDADLYVGAHRHMWGLQQFEITERDKCPVFVRVAGYKKRDKYAQGKGYEESTYGHSVLTIFDPNASPAGRVLAFADVDQGVRVLRALRGGK